MPSYPVSPVSAIPDVHFPGGDQAAGMVAVPICALSWPVVRREALLFRMEVKDLMALPP